MDNLVWYRTWYLNTIHTEDALKELFKTIALDDNTTANQKALYIYENGRVFQNIVLPNTILLAQLAILLPYEKTLELVTSELFLDRFLTYKDPNSLLDEIVFNTGNTDSIQTFKHLITLVQPYCQPKQAEAPLIQEAAHAAIRRRRFNKIENLLVQNGGHSLHKPANSLPTFFSDNASQERIKKEHSASASENAIPLMSSSGLRQNTPNAFE